jgi:hypothetical protein
MMGEAFFRKAWSKTNKVSTLSYSLIYFVYTANYTISVVPVYCSHLYAPVTRELGRLYTTYIQQMYCETVHIPFTRDKENSQFHPK